MEIWILIHEISIVNFIHFQVKTFIRLYPWEMATEMTLHNNETESFLSARGDDADSDGMTWVAYVCEKECLAVPADVPSTLTACRAILMVNNWLSTICLFLAPSFSLSNAGGEYSDHSNHSDNDAFLSARENNSDWYRGGWVLCVCYVCVCVCMYVCVCVRACTGT